MSVEVIDLLWSDDEEEVENVPPPRKKRRATSTSTRAPEKLVYSGVATSVPDKKKAKREAKLPSTAVAVSNHEKKPPAKKINSVSVRLDFSSLPSDTVPSVLLETGATMGHQWLWMQSSSASASSCDSRYQEEALAADWNRHVAQCSSSSSSSKKNKKPTLHDVAALSKKHSVLHGKWIMHTYPGQIDRIWKFLKTMMETKTICTTAKMGVNAASQGSSGTAAALHLFCIYVHDFTDKATVDAVVQELRQVCKRKWLHFKSDSMTALNIYSDNPYKMKVSFYRHQKKDDGAVVTESEQLYDLQKAKVASL
jgi:hypothetical protein